MLTERKRNAIDKCCAATNCNNSKNKNPDLAFFGFPKDLLLSRKWVIACRRKDMITKTANWLSRTTALCERHFKANCFKSAKRRSLTSRAIPTIFDFKISQLSPQISHLKSELDSLPSALPALPSQSPPLLSIDLTSPAPRGSRISSQETTVPEAARERFDRDVMSDKSNVDHSETHSEGLNKTSRDVNDIASDAAGGVIRTSVGTEEEQVLKIHLPFKDEEMMMLVMEYLHLYETVQHLKELARINVDLLYVCTDVSKMGECKEEMLKVQGLVDTLMNGTKVYKIEMANSEEEETTEDDLNLDKEQNMLEGSLSNSSKELVNGQDDGVTEMEESFTDIELSRISNIEKVDPTTSEIIKPIPNNSPSKQKKNPKNGKVKSAISVSSINKKTLKNRLELEQVLESQESHDGFGLRVCTVCHRLFDCRASLSLHLATAHLQNKCYVCRYCLKEFRTRTVMEKHLLSHQETTQATVKEEEVATSSEALGQNVYSSSSKDNENIELDKRASASIKQENDVFVSPSPHQVLTKTLKNRLELEQYLESPESQDGSESRVCKFCGCRFKGKLSLTKHLVKIHLEDKRLICGYCGKEFKKGCRLKEHMLLHQKIIKNECADCGKQFSSKHTLYLHKKLTHFINHDWVLCSICGIKLKTTSSLRRHIKTHTEDQGEKTFVCDICGKAYKSELSLKGHKRWVHIKGKEACKVCGKMINKGNMPRHMLIHTGAKPYKCSLCHRAFNQSNERNAHQKRHAGQYPHYCSDCGVGFNTNHALRIHTNAHSRKKQFSCSGCDKLFRSEELATAHTEELGLPHVCTSTCITDKRIAKYKCPYCNKQFAERVRFATHLFSIHNKELDRCLICNNDVSFASLVDLESHMTSFHLNEKPFKCRTCGESFYMFGTFYAHQTLLLHSNKKVIKCKDCGKSYSSYQGLRDHRLFKHSLQPMKGLNCEICGRQFRSKGNFKRHQTGHSGLKPFECNVCGSTFAQKSTLETHSWTHTNAKKYQCVKCDHGYNDKRNYTSHLKKSHPELSIYDTDQSHLRL